MTYAITESLFVVYRIAARKAPPGDHGIRQKAHPLPPECQGTESCRTACAADDIVDRALLEGIVLTRLICVIFARYLLSDGSRSAWVLLFVVAFVILNAVVSQ